MLFMITKVNTQRRASLFVWKIPITIEKACVRNVEIVYLNSALARHFQTSDF